MTSTIDKLDASHSRLRFILSNALSMYPEESLLELILDSDIILRTAAARQIHTSGTIKSFEFALSLVKSGRFDDREMGAFILGQLGAPRRLFCRESLPSLFKLLDDPYYEVRASSVGAIGFLQLASDTPVPGVLEKIIPLRNDQEESVRAALGYTLAFMRDSNSYECLKSMAKDISPEVRQAINFAMEIHDDENGRTQE